MGADKQMEIQSLKLTNFRGIEQAELALDGKSAVIYGINGMGKSTVLRACSVLFFRILNMLTESDLGSDGKVKIEDSDIKIGAQTARISMQLNIDHTIYPYFRGAESNGKRIHLVGEAKRIVEQFRRLYVGQYMVLEEEETDESDRESTRELVFNESNMPIYASYGVNRYVSDRRNKVLKKDIKLGGKLEALRDVFDPTINFQLFFDWFRGRQEYENSKRVEKESFKDPQLSAVREAILKIMDNDFSDIKIKIDDEDAQMVAVKHHTELSIAQLSEGEKCVLAMTGDLARKLAIANPSRENPLEGEGVVLIDEVDLHLHPSWQGRMMPLLFRTFPNIQFIVTTHSPKVLSEIKDEANIFEIYQDGNAINVRKQNSMNGWDINHIMRDFMHTDILNEEPQKLIDEIYNCIENENFDQAEELVDQLAKITDEMNVEVVRARTLIHRKR